MTTRGPIEAVPTAVTAFVGSTAKGPVHKPTLVADVAAFESTFGTLSARFEMGYVVRTFFENGGQVAAIVRVRRARGLPQAVDLIGSPTKKTGLYALAALDHFDLLCLPPVHPDGDTDWSVYAAALAYCRDRRAFLLVDAPSAWGADYAGAGTVLSSFTQSPLPVMQSRENAALYFPRIYVSDPLRTGQSRLTVPSGAVAGVIARTDRDHGIWKSPAGRDTRLQGVVGLQVDLSNAENGQLNPAGINCLRHFNGIHVVWGARTLSSNDEWRYVTVRRVALYLEAAIGRGVAWARLEPNAEPLWTALRNAIGDFLHDLYKKGAFQGAVPKDAYFVKCDADTTTQEDRQAGVVNVIVGFAPHRPSEFVLLHLQIQAAGVI